MTLCACGCGKEVKTPGCKYTTGHNPNTLAQCIRGWNPAIHTPKPAKIWTCIDCGVLVNRRSKRCKACHSVANRGRVVSEATKIKANLTRLIKYGSFKNMPGGFKKGHKIKPGNSFKVGNIPWNKGKNMPMISKEKHPNWKGGVTPFHMVIRELKEHNEWSRNVLQRDKHKCQRCGAKHQDKRLEAHHRRRFSDILQDFILENKALSIVADKEELIRRAKLYNPFWDVDNGVTVCEDCHKDITFRFHKIFPTFQCLCREFCYI